MNLEMHLFCCCLVSSWILLFYFNFCWFKYTAAFINISNCKTTCHKIICRSIVYDCAGL